jgi:hypothetical protein
MTALPFLLSAMLHLSGVFAIFSPFPLLLMMPAFPAWAMVAALMTNALWVALLLNVPSSALFLGYCAPIVFLARALLVRRGWAFKPAVLAGFAFHACLLALILLGYVLWASKGASPWSWFTREMDAWISHLTQVSGEAIREADLTPEQVRQTVWTQLPAVLFSALFIGIFGNFLLFVRMVPLQIPARSDPAPYKSWRNPEWLVIPTLACGFTMLFVEGSVGTVASNFFRFFAVLYGVQGIGVLSVLLDRWKIFGFFRSLLYLSTLLFLFPVVAVAGFFDLWFDFRSKFRQS